VDALSGASTAVGSKEITLPPLDRQVVDFKATIPQADKARFLQLKATFTPTRASAEAASIAPILVIDPKAPLKPMTTFNPPGAPNMGFIVTRGFRNVLDTGTGTQETPPGWGLPDDLVWAYEHQMKQVGSRSHTLANKLYVTENDMRHYSTPWRDMPDGEYFYDIAAPLLVERMQKVAGWKTSDTAILGHSDRWDTGPSNGALYGWQDYESFNDYLLAHGKPGLTGKTREELAQEIQDRHESDWMQWGLDRYVHAIRELREDFAAAGKKLVITAQGLPLLPRPAEVEISKTIVGMSDDCTWGMTNESVSLTTGRQMGELAFNPDWRMSTLNQWGYNSGLLENAHWHTPVGTTEPSRRNIYDRAFRGVIRSDGAYTSMHVFGYNNNAGLSYLMTDNDWQEWDREMQRHSLLTPDAPIGAGLVISSSGLETPGGVAFSGTGEMNDRTADVTALQNTLRRLQEEGVSISFSANAGVLAAEAQKSAAASAPLILLNLNHFSESELLAIKSMVSGGVQVAAFQDVAANQVTPAAQSLFGVTASGAPAAGRGVGMVDNKSIVAHGNALFVPIAADDLSVTESKTIAPLLKTALRQSIVFPPGTEGYGFVSNGENIVLVEDWRETGRVAPLRWHADPSVTAIHAASVNDSAPLSVHRDGADWVIDVPIRPGDGTLVAIEEVTS